MRDLVVGDLVSLVGRGGYSGGFLWGKFFNHTKGGTYLVTLVRKYRGYIPPSGGQKLMVNGDLWYYHSSDVELVEDDNEMYY